MRLIALAEAQIHLLQQGKQHEEAAAASQSSEGAEGLLLQYQVCSAIQAFFILHRYHVVLFQIFITHYTGLLLGKLMLQTLHHLKAWRARKHVDNEQKAI